MYLMLVLVLALEPPHSLRRLTLLRLLLLEPIVLQSQRTEKKPTLPCSCPQLLCLLMHNTATRSSSPRLLRLSQRMLQLNLSALHHLPQCLLPLHPLMLRNDVSIRGSELLSSARDLN